MIPILRSLPGLALGLIFLAAGFLKGADPLEFVRQVETYEIVSGRMAVALAYALIPVEIVLGLALLLGLWTRLAGGAAIILLAVFTAATAYAWAHGKPEGCGCFGSLASRAPAQVLVEDLGFLALAVLVVTLGGGAGGPRSRWRVAVFGAGLAGAVLLPLTAYALPLDPIVTDLRVGRSVDKLPLRESPVDLEDGDHLLALLDLDSPHARAIVSRLNAYSGTPGAPPVIAFYGGEVDEKAVFWFNYDPNFELVTVPRNELKRLYRKLPRFFRVRDGRIVQIWNGEAPSAKEIE